MSYYTKALRGLSFSTRAEKTRSFLAASPVKLFSNLWNSAAGTVSQEVVKPQQPALHRNNSIHSMLGSIRGNSRPNTADGRPENPLVRLEETFTGFIAALQSRKGAIIGRALFNRSMADELAVNDIYNRFIETPFDYRVPSETGTEVIFVAFENFLRIAWTEQMGPVMTMRALNNLVERANKRVPGDFADFVRYLFKDMAPQNRRAFTALIKLLADLLDGCGSDSDRGALTIAFAELLVTDGDAQGYMNLLDRLVEDCDRLFDSNQDAEEFAGMRAKHTGSVTSNTSSLRRKFGLDVLLRQNSKDERPSVWRTLSRHRNPATGDSASLSRATGDRARALDDNSLSKRMHRRAMSRDRPTLLGAFESPSSSDAPLDTIGERTPSKSVKTKRRSSLSDLKSLMAATTLQEDDQVQVQPLQATKPAKVNASPKSRIPISPNAALALRHQKENEAAPNTDIKALELKSKPVLSGIPTLKPAARPVSRPASPTRAPKLRLQSPAKLRERLQAEKQVATEVDASLKTEVSNIGEEIARVRPAETSSLKELERKIGAMMCELHAKQAATQHDVDTTLKTAHERARAVDQLHKEVVAENELLYERFQGELGKILKAVKGKGREDKEELLGRLKEQGDENARLKKENARLKRELAGLRARVEL